MKLKLLIIFISIYSASNCQSYQQEFEKHYAKRDTINQSKVLIEWNKSNTKSPELFISYFKYFLSKSEKKNPNLESKEVIMSEYDTDDSDERTFRDEILGSVRFFDYDKKYLISAMIKIDEGITLFPNRLDLILSKIYVLGMINDCNKFSSEIIKTIKYSVQNKNKWKWSKNKDLNNGEIEFLKLIHKYKTNFCYKRFYSKNRYSINTEIIQNYPNNILSLLQLAIHYIDSKNLNKSFEFLSKAERIDKKNIQVLKKIAYYHKQKKDTLNAIKYYDKIIEYGVCIVHMLPSGSKRTIQETL